MRSLPCAGRRLLIAAALVGLVLAARSAMAQSGVPAAVKPYEQVSGISGNLNSIGSDTLNNLMTYWAEAFAQDLSQREAPGRGQGLGHGPARPDAGHRPAWAHVAEDEDRRGRRLRGEARFQADADRRGPGLPGRLRPQGQPRSTGFTLAQLDCIFSKTRKSGFADITTWGEVGLTGRLGDAADQPLRP